MPDFLEEKRKEISQRLKELRPLVDEYHRLEAAEQALSGVGNGRHSTNAAPATQRRTRSARAKSSGTGRRGRPRGSGTRAIQALELVKARPGITIPELAEAMGIKQNYLYRVMPGLAEEGKVTKSGRGWHSREGSDVAA
jgi:CRP-like cAMP-binding protein